MIKQKYAKKHVESIKSEFFNWASLEEHPNILELYDAFGNGKMFKKGQLERKGVTYFITEYAS